MLAQGLDLNELLDRIAAIGRAPAGTPAAEALLGVVEVPQLTVTQAFEDIYLKEIMPAELLGKSENQKADWKKVKQRAVNNFVAVVGDVAISSIMRDQAQKFYQFWLGRVAPETGAPTHSASSGNRNVGNMRQLFREYHVHIGDRDRTILSTDWYSAKRSSAAVRPLRWSGFAASSLAAGSCWA